MQASVSLVEDKLSRNYARKLDISKIAVAAKPGLGQGQVSPFVDRSADSEFGHQ